jgi:THO complex subunit 4
MSGKLDQSLDQIMKDTKPAAGRGRRTGNRPRSTRRAATRAKAAIAAPAGGIQKNTKTNTKAATTAAKAVAPMTGDSKIIVSNLPEDVNETQIKVRLILE